MEILYNSNQGVIITISFKSFFVNDDQYNLNLKMDSALHTTRQNSTMRQNIPKYIMINHKFYISKY